jgi:hypothetical protein
MSNATKKPRPYVKACTQEDLAWDPVCREQFTIDAETGEVTRSGDSFAVCRSTEPSERWPLGHVSDVYRPSSHRHTVDMLLEAAGHEVEPFGQPLASGHGYRVVHQFSVKKENEVQVHGLPITSRLTVVHDHTGLHALKARMVVYVGTTALGSIVGARAIHVAENPDRWRVEVEAMVERSRMAQDALTSLLAAADAYVLRDADRSLLTALGVKPSGKDWGVTLLDSMVKYHKGACKDMTWGVWARRLEDDGIMAMVKILGPKKFGVALDLALGGNRYGKKATDEARKAKPVAVAA